MEASRGRKLGWYERQFAGAPLPWLLPVIVVIGIFYLYPVLDVLRLSFTDATLIGDRNNFTFNSIINALTSPQLPGVIMATATASRNCRSVSHRRSLTTAPCRNGTIARPLPKTNAPASAKQ